MKKVVAIFGYNNTRLYDVVKLKDLILKRCGAKLLLVREVISETDREVTPYCLEHNPDSADVVEPLKLFLKNNNLELLGCLPFSDRGVVGAAYAAKAFNLFGDDAISSHAMLDKSKFRNLESNINIDSSEYKKPFFEVVYNVEELNSLFKERNKFFIKPTSEGNSRGCMKIENQEDLNRWYKENPESLKKGVICEEILSNQNEYSFDGVGGSYWITKKFTTSGAYKAEYQHVMPAPLSTDLEIKIHNTLEPVLEKLGSNGGAFHHEFFILDDGRLASVEPNRRPAGMWLWDLASWAFENFNPWESWIDICTRKNLNKKIKLKPKKFAGVRGVISNKDGIISKINHIKINKELSELFDEKNFKFSFLKAENSTVKKIPKDNSDFLAFIALKNSDYDDLLKNLEKAEEIILNNLEIES